MQSTKTLHICCREDPYNSKRLYGKEKVERELKKDIKYCNHCSFFKDLLLYVNADIREVKTLIPCNSEFSINFTKVPIGLSNNGTLYRHIPSYIEKNSTLQDFLNGDDE